MSHFRSLMCLIGACSVLLLSSTTLSAQSIPQQMSYQGVIRQGDKVPADGNYRMTFTLYSSITGSQPIWSETQEVQLRGGLFNVYLGEVKPLPSPMPANVWVGMRIGAEEEFSRTRLTSVPYANTAGTAQALAPDAKGAVLSLNGQQGALEFRGDDGLTVNSDNGVLTIGLSAERKAEEALTTTEWLLAGNTNATASSWLGTSNNFPLVIKTNNTERMRVLSTGNGNVGIGVTNPGARLTVARTFHLTNTGGAPELELSAASGANSTTFKTTTQSSNIVYTLPPNDGDNGDILSTDGTGDLTWVEKGWGITGNSDISSTKFLGTTNSQPLIIKTNNAERFRVTSGGAMGINEDNPSQKLEVGGNILVKPDGSGTGELRIQESNGGTGNNYTAFKSPNMAVNITYTLPNIAPSADQVLASSAAGVLSWVSPSGASGIAGGDLDGTYPNPQIAAGVIVDADISGSANIAYGKLNLTGGIVNSDISNSANIDYNKLDLNERIVNADISDTAAIAYSKLDLAGNIVDADISGTAAIGYSKLDLTGSIVNSDVSGTAAIAYSKLDLADGIVDADINSAAAVAYSKLDLAGNIVDADISGTAAIAYSKLDLTGNIVNADVSATAAIAYSKLDLTGNIVNADISGTAAIAYSKLDLAGSIVDADVSGTAAIAYSKLDLAGNIVNSDISGTAAIAYSKLNLTGNIVNADVSGTAAIAYSKLDLVNGIVNADINTAAAIAYSKLNLAGAIVNADISGTAAIAYSKLDLAGNIVNADISGTAAIAYSKLNLTGSIVNADVSGTAAIAYSKLDLVNGIVNADINTAASIAYSKLNLAGAIVNADVSGTAAIAYSKLDLAGNIVNADVSGTAAIAYSKLNLAGAIVNADISGTAAIAYGKLNLTNSIQNADIVSSAITSSKISNGNVTTSKLADSAVSGLKLLTSAVQTGHLANSAVTNAKIADNAVNGSKIAMGSDATGDIMYYNGTDYVRLPIGSASEVLTVTGGIPTWEAGGGGGSPTGAAGGDLSGTYPNPDIAAGVIVNADINGSAAIAYSKLALNNSIVANDLTSNSVTTSKIADNAVDGAKIALGSDANGDMMYYNGTNYVRRAIGSNGDVLTVSGGVPTWAAPSGGGGASVRVRAYRNGQQTINTNTTLVFETVVFNTEDYDTGSEFNSSTGVFTAASSGYYLISSTTTWGNNAAGVRAIRITRNGSTSAARGSGNVSNTLATTSTTVSTVIQLTAGDTVEIEVAGYSGSASTTTVESGTDLSYLQITKIQ